MNITDTVMPTDISQTTGMRMTKFVIMTKRITKQGFCRNNVIIDLEWNKKSNALDAKLNYV